MSSVTIYTTPSCTYCKMAKAYFQENAVQYQEKNVATDIDARNVMIQKSGQLGVPVIEIDNKIIIGFDKPKLQELLGIK